MLYTRIPSQDSASYEYQSHLNLVLQGLNILRHQGNFIDVTLIVEGQKFKAHKVVLSACSDYFCAMFTDNMIEARRNEIELNGISANGFFLVLEYAYTGKITIDLSSVQDILHAAAQFQMLDLVEACAIYLGTQIDNDNCVDITTIAETYSLVTLKRVAYTFMNGILSTFSNTEEFYRLSSSQLESLLAYNLPVDCSEDEVLKCVMKWYFLNKIRSNVSATEAAQIIRHIHFSDIPHDKIRSIFREIEVYRDFDCDFHHFIVKEIVTSRKDMKVPTNLLNPRGMKQAIVTIGGFGRTGITNDITFKFTSELQWKVLTTIPHLEQSNFGTAVLNNDLFVVGGCFNQFMQENVHPFGFRYNTLHDKWTTLNPMKVDRCRFSLNVAGGMIYAIGGVDDDDITQSCECYDPATDEWRLIQQMPTLLSQHAGATYENGSTSKIFICGGKDAYSLQCNSMYCYEVREDEWTMCTPMLQDRVDHVMLSIDNFLYVCGGWRADEVDSRILVDTIDVYDVERDCWSIKTKVPTPRYHVGIVCVSRKIYFIGGFDIEPIYEETPDIIECYDIDNDIWTTEEKYPQDIWEHTCVSMYIPQYRDCTSLC